MSTYYLYNGELYHWGVKGMKWGIRRYRNPDGSLTPAGKRRYGADGAGLDHDRNSSSQPTRSRSSGSTKTISKSTPKRSSVSTGKTVSKKQPSEKSTHRSRLEAKYMEKGMTKEQAAAAAARRIKTEKIVAGAAALTLAAAATYVATKQIKYRCDHLIKSGTIVQRIQREGNFDINDGRAIYAAYKKNDKLKYRGLFGGGHIGVGAHKVDLTAAKDVRIASRKKAEDVFLDLYRNDPVFKQNFDKANDLFNGAPGVNRKWLNTHPTKKHKSDRIVRTLGYDAFNTTLVGHTKEANAAAKTFYDRLRKMGYDAVMDVNDMKYSGYRAKAPVIVFNKANTMKVSNIKKFTEAELVADNKAARGRMFAEEIIAGAAKGFAADAAVLGGSGAIAGLITKVSKDHSNNSKIIQANNTKVRNYKNEHPNTQLTDKEILEMLNKKG